jgi:hypothetical protein
LSDHDDILGSERRGKTPFDIGQEPLSGHGAVDGLRRSHAMTTQRRHQGDCLPVPLRHMADQPLVSRKHFTQITAVLALTS